MNLLEGLGRQIARVIQMRSDADSMKNLPGVNMRPYIMVCDMAIEEGQQALGSDDIGRMKAAYEELEEIN